MVHKTLDPTQSETFRRNMISSAGLSIGLVVIVSTFIRSWISPVPLGVKINFLLTGALLTLIPLLLRRGIPNRVAGSMLVVAISLLAINAGLFNGGVRAPATSMFILTPIVGFLCMGRFGAILALLLSFFGILGLLFAESFAWISPLKQVEKYSEYISFIYLAGATAAFLIGLAYERSRKISEQVILKLYESANESAKMASLGQMSAGVAHEINNPLAIIQASLHFLSKTREDPEKFEAKIESIQNAVHRISKIVGGLKKFSRTDGISKLEFHRLSSIAKESLELTKTHAHLHQTQLTLESNYDGFILCNDIEVEQVFINLINNAIDAVKDKNKKWVKITIFEQDSEVVVQVSDSGIGIPEEIQQKIFDPFFTTKAIGEGTGLGLSITKGILDQHHTTIRVLNSVPNTCFEIRFPKATI